MATKNDLQRTLNWTGELARESGLIGPDDRLVLLKPSGGQEYGIVPWGVAVIRSEGDGRAERNTLTFLPGSGASVGTTKREAQETLQTVNGVLAALTHKRRMDKLGY